MYTYKWMQPLRTSGFLIQKIDGPIFLALPYEPFAYGCHSRARELLHMREYSKLRYIQI